MNLIRTISTFYKNPYINPHLATARHIGWQFRKSFNLFPYDISFPNFTVRIADRSIANGTGPLLNAMGFYDPNNMYLLEEVFKKRMFSSFLDIGANIGIYSLIAASTGNAKVTAFEPHPRTFSFLQENISLNSFEEYITGFQAALGEKDSETYLTDEPGSAINHVVNGKGQTSRCISVKLTRGDTYCHEHDVFPDVVKIDVEGYENLVLRGFGSILPNLKLIFIECGSLYDTSRILCGQYGFLGPFKYSYRTHEFTKKNINYEDWIFINPRIVQELSNGSFQFDTNGVVVG